MIGVIADDVTGATDVAAALSRAGLRTLLALTPELDDSGSVSADADAVVIGLKTRSMPVDDAVRLSLTALSTLQSLGAQQFYIKYCSTFDSTPEGNIGPITDAVAEELGVPLVLTTPAAPLHGRTVYQGHLFVGESLLAETHMRDHPVTPMRESSALRLLTPQTTGEVELLSLDVVRAGVDEVRDRIAAAQDAGVTHLVADATGEDDLLVLAEAIDGAPLAAGSAGLIGAMAMWHPQSEAEIPAPAPGRTAILAGSCSRRTLEQITHFQQTGGASYRLIAGEDESAEQLAERALRWWDAQPAEASALIYSSSTAAEREGTDPALGALYERAAGVIAAGLNARGIRRLLIAGGETSGEVIKALGTQVAVVGREAALGAPWIHDTAHGLQMVLKSGNFGDADLFVDVAREGALV
ncbi:3-oxo-tetronate kinase [Microbacterium istanbulense]|uniref:3-oxo-tetronate kinase n=1 Tax=Microbacterium istanbulense TaxID=3122049 RepID=A0ABU8LJG2_9MICO